jgi:1-acyl-sn-glycerol-3-phosphate acyltransferase
MANPETLAAPVPLTPEVIHRVEAGVAAARNPEVRRYVDTTLARLGQEELAVDAKRVSGRWRRWILRSLLSLAFDIRIEQPESIPTQPGVLVANHLSHLDPFLLLAAAPPDPYYYSLGDARTLFDQAWKRWIVGNAGGVIPLERWWKEEVAVMAAATDARPDLKPLAEAIKTHVPSGNSIQQMRQIDQAVQGILQRGDGILLFPEGRLGEQEGKLHLPLKRGTVLYALRSGVPITPVAIFGTRHLRFRQTLTLRFGPALHLPQENRPKRATIDAAIAQLETALLDLLAEPPSTPQSQHPRPPSP